MLCVPIDAAAAAHFVFIQFVLSIDRSVSLQADMTQSHNQNQYVKNRV